MGKVKWLSDDEQEAWRAFMWMKAVLDEELDRQLQREAGMPHAYYMILAMLSEASDQALRMSDLASILKASPSRVSHAVTKLERLGWVVRESAADDGRVSYAVLTKSGFAVLKAAAPSHVATVRQAIFDHLSRAQVAQLKQISTQILDALDAGPVFNHE